MTGTPPRRIATFALSLPRVVSGMLAVLLIAFPWLYNGAAGPAPYIEPLLVSLSCVAGLLMLRLTAGDAQLPRSLLLVLAGFALFIGIGDYIARSAFAPSSFSAAAWLAIAAVGACAALSGHPPRAHATEQTYASLLAWGLLLASVLSTVIALTQYFGVSKALGSLAAHSQGQVFANLRQRNHFASLTTLGVLSLVWLSAHGTPKRFPRRLMWPLGLLLLTGTAVAASRTGVVQLMALVGLAICWRGQASARILRRLLLAIALFAAILLAQFAWSTPGQGASLLMRLMGDAPDCHGRRMLWANLLDAVAQRPWLGWGWHELAYAAYASNGRPRFCAVVENAHNLPLHIAVELGLPAALAFCLVCVWAVVRSKPWADTNPPRQLGWGVLLLIAIHSMVEYPLWYGPFQMVLGLGLGLLLHTSEPALRISRLALLTTGVFFMGTAAYVHSDYRRVSQLFVPIASRPASFGDEALAKAKESWLFRDLAGFAELAGQPLTIQTAPRQFDLSGKVLHFSPEPRVIEKRIQSGLMLGFDAEVAAESRRYQAAFPAEHARWIQRQAPP